MRFSLALSLLLGIPAAIAAVAAEVSNSTISARAAQDYEGLSRQSVQCNLVKDRWKAIPVEDIEDLIDRLYAMEGVKLLQNGWIGDSVFQYQVRGALLCVKNPWYLPNRDTHLTMKEASWVADAITVGCTDGAGGRADCYGDNGLTLATSLQHVDHGCA